MFCEKCGHKLEIDCNFCEKCGTKVKREQLEEIINEYEKQKKKEKLPKPEKKIEIDLSDYKPDDLDIIIKKNSPLKIFLIIIVFAVIASGGYVFVKNSLKQREVEVEENNQSILDEYAKEIEKVTGEYLLKHEVISDFSEISNLIKYDKHNIICDNIFINIDGTVYLSECKIDNKSVSEVYGKRKNIVTKDSEACNVNYNQNKGRIEFYSDGKIASVYECENYKCGQYKNENIDYNSCEDMITIIEDGQYKYLYNYQAGQAIFDKLDEIIAVKNNKKYLGFIVKDSETKKYGYIDTRGIAKLEIKYDSLGLISDGIIYDRGFNLNEDKIIASLDGKYGVIKFSNGKEIVPFNYDNIYISSNDKYVVKTDKKYNIINLKGEKLLKNEYDMIFDFDDILVVSDDSKIKILDSKEEKIIEDEIDIIIDYKEEAINGIFGYNATKVGNTIEIEVNSSTNNGYNSTIYNYDIINNKLSKKAK